VLLLAAHCSHMLLLLLSQAMRNVDNYWAQAWQLQHGKARLATAVLLLSFEGWGKPR